MRKPPIITGFEAVRFRDSRDYHTKGGTKSIAFLEVLDKLKIVFAGWHTRCT